jgi:hypothetical protein
MSSDTFTPPKIKLNNELIASDNEDDFEKRLEEMKAEIEQLETDFSKQTLDQLVNQQLSTPRSEVGSNFSDLGNDDAVDGPDLGTPASAYRPRRTSDLLVVPTGKDFMEDDNKSDGSILFGKEYLNNSQNTIRSISNSSLFSKNHYRNFDPNGDCLSERDRDDLNLEDGNLLIDRDTLDLIKPSDFAPRRSFNGRTFPKEQFAIDEDEKLLQNDEVDDEWVKFLREAQIEEPEDDSIFKKSKKTREEEERQRIEYYRSFIKEDILRLTEKKGDSEAPAMYSQTVMENQILKEKEMDSSTFNKEINEILNIETILLVLSRRSLHLYLSSDLEISRWKKFFMKFLKKNYTNHEGLFGVSQIYFSIGLHELALNYCTKAIENSTAKIPQYNIWRSLYLYFIYLNYKSENIKDKKVLKYFLSCESAAFEAEKLANTNFSAQYLLLILSLEKIILEKYHKSWVNSNLKTPSSYASKIMKLNKYMGYICWAEIYLRDSKKKNLGNDVLQDLIAEYPKFPHAFLIKWRKDFDAENYLDSLGPMEELFLKEEEMYTIPELKIVICLLYAKSLGKTNQYVLAWDLIQNEFYKKPTHTAYLYLYGKYAVKSPLVNFSWTAIGILKEWINSCSSQRKAKIYFYLGLAYKKTKQPLKALKYFEKSKKEFSKNKSLAESFCLGDKNITVIDKNATKYHKLQNYEFLIK